MYFPPIISTSHFWHLEDNNKHVPWNLKTRLQEKDLNKSQLSIVVPTSNNSKKNKYSLNPTKTCSFLNLWKSFIKLNQQIISFQNCSSASRTSALRTTNHSRPAQALVESMTSDQSKTLLERRRLWEGNKWRNVWGSKRLKLFGWSWC